MTLTWRARLCDPVLPVVAPVRVFLWVVAVVWMFKDWHCAPRCKTQRPKLCLCLFLRRSLTLSAQLKHLQKHFGVDLPHGVVAHMDPLLIKKIDWETTNNLEDWDITLEVGTIDMLFYVHSIHGCYCRQRLQMYGRQCLQMYYCTWVLR